MGRSSVYADAAAGLGRLFAERGIGLVYGGATVGTMGVIADAALAAGGSVSGVIPREIFATEVPHQGLTELHEVADMHERKATMARLSDAFIALPGGAGTLEELFEVWTWAQLGLHRKPIGLLDVNSYYRRLEPMLDHMVTEGFLRAGHRDVIRIRSDAAALVDELVAAAGAITAGTRPAGADGTATVVTPSGS